MKESLDFLAIKDNSVQNLYPELIEFVLPMFKVYIVCAVKKQHSSFTRTTPAVGAQLRSLLPSAVSISKKSKKRNLSYF